MNSMHRFRSCRALASLAVLACVAGPAVAAGKPDYVLQVKVQKALQSDVTRPLYVTGVVAATQSGDLAFRVGGTVIERNVQTGDTVKAGQVLARLGTAELEASITSARADVASAKASVDLATSDLARQKSLLDKGFATRSAYDQSAKTLDVASAQLRIAESQLQIAQDNLSYAELKAGADGVVTAVNIEVGQVVQAGQAAFSVATGDAKQAVFDVSETLMAHAKISRAEIVLAADPSVKAEIRVAEVSPTVNLKTGTVRIKADIVDPPARMTLGATVTGVGSSQPISGIVLPFSALARANGSPVVWVVDPNTRKVSARKVEVQQYIGETMVVSGEVKDGDLVVVQGGSFLSPDLAVSYTEVKP